MARCIMEVALFILTSLLGFPLSVLSNIAVKDLQSNDTVDTFADLQASFGPDFPHSGLEGRIKMASPANACHPIAHAPPILDQYGWIAIIARGGNCEFALKVLEAKNAGYNAAIVYNYPGKDSLVKMGADSKESSQIDIPSTFVGYSTGKQLLKMFEEHGEYVVQILEVEDIDYRMYLWPFAIVVGICFFMVMLFLVIKFMRDHMRTTVARLSKKHLKKIPIRKFKKGQYYDTCAICLDEYEDGEKIRILPCDHAYHMKCIDPWLTQNKKTCPVCKRRVIPGRDPNSDSDSEDDGGSRLERTPLLRASSQSGHGSINVAVAEQQTGRLQEAVDESRGAVGGAGISGQVQVRVEQEIDGGEQREARRPRRDRNGGLGEAGASGVSEEGVDERKAERREKRKKKRDKKREERRRRLMAEIEEGSRILANILAEPANLLEEAPVVDVETEQVYPPNALAGGEETAAVSQAEAAAEGYINPSYTESQEVVVPGSGKKREMSEVV